MGARFDPWTVTVTPDATVRRAIETINNGRAAIALVIGPSGHLIGAVTDGDVRRGLLRGIDLDAPASEIMHRDPLTGRVGDSSKQLVGIMRERSIRQIPLLDEGGRLVDLALMSDLVPEATHPNRVLLMVGGRGSRLSPLTDDTPKALLKVGDRPLLETILGQLRDHNFVDVFLAIHFQAAKIKEFCGDGTRWGLRIRYLEEQEYLGTAGAVATARDQLEEPFIVMNGDLLTRVNLEQLLAYHVDSGRDATIAVREYHVHVPFGTVQLDGDRVVAIKEKPNERFLINAGLYVLEPAIADLVPQRQHFDMPDLIDAAIRAGRSVGSFPVHEYWMDIGRVADFERASKDFPQNFPADQR